MNPLNPLRLIRYHITLVQLEQYNLGRYFGVLCRRYAIRVDMRQKAVWTAKLKVIFLLALIFIFTIASVFLFLWNAFVAMIFLIISIFIFPFYIALAVLLTVPLDLFLKRRIIGKAKRKIAFFPRLKIIGITGSYGKTTMKETLTTILAERFAVLATEDSVNTPIGVARFILEKLSKETEVFVVEMGAHHKGDITALCALTPPDISMLTGINEAHIERFGGIANTINAKFEIVRHAKNNAVVILNADDKRIKNEYAKKLYGHTTIFYGMKAGDMPRYDVADVRFEHDGLRQSFSLTNKHGEAYRLTTPLLGDYAPATIMGAVCAAETLGMTRAEITQGSAMTRPIAHRLEPFNAANGVLIIDDSYNGNPDGAREAIRVLARFKNRRKLYITPGLVEMGKTNAEIHRTIGRELAMVADIVILIRNSTTAFIMEGLISANFKKQNILWFANVVYAHAALPHILKKGDVVLFQNDWPDNYL